MNLMELEIDPQKTALLAIDMQNDLVKENGGLPKMPNVDILDIIEENNVIEKVKKAIKAAREAKMPVFHVKTVHRENRADIFEPTTDMSLEGFEIPPILIEGTWGSEFVEEIEPKDEDYVVKKRGSNSFYATDLETLLRSLGIETLIVTGVITDGCVDATVQGARERNFDVIVLTDCTATMTKKVQEFWSKNVFPRMAVTLSTDEFMEITGH